jgi:hypothetical protein
MISAADTQISFPSPEDANRSGSPAVVLSCYSEIRMMDKVHKPFDSLYTIIRTLQILQATNETEECRLLGCDSELPL